MADHRADVAFSDSVHTHVSNGAPTRREMDSLGAADIPEHAYWGINVLRALDNFPISGRPISIYPDLIFGYACVKQAAARANAELGCLDAECAQLIDRACEEIKDGRLREQFVVDIMQGGAGTSTNMNFNEVIANRALELAGRAKGDYAFVDPNDHVNCSQSTNDTYPTALRIGLCLALERMVVELQSLSEALNDKARSFSGIVKIGRTQLQDAVPMTLGQEFEGFSITLADDLVSFARLMSQLGQINLGATAIGTGVNAPAGFAAVACTHLAYITGYDLVTAPHLIEATTDVGDFIDLSGALRRTAVKLSKICNDLRLLASGPQSGLGEIVLPARQAGSSIMPGKVNPVIPEAINQVAFVVAGGDVTMTLAAEAGQLQLNAFGPVMAHVLFEHIQWMTAAMKTLRENCIVGITANTSHLAEQVSMFAGVATALVPAIGYGRAVELAQASLREHRSVAELAVSSGTVLCEGSYRHPVPQHSGYAGADLDREHAGQSEGHRGVFASDRASHSGGDAAFAWRELTGSFPQKDFPKASFCATRGAPFLRYLYTRVRHRTFSKAPSRSSPHHCSPVV